MQTTSTTPPSPYTQHVGELADAYWAARMVSDEAEARRIWRAMAEVSYTPCPDAQEQAEAVKVIPGPAPELDYRGAGVGRHTWHVYVDDAEGGDAVAGAFLAAGWSIDWREAPTGGRRGRTGGTSSTAKAMSP